MKKNTEILKSFLIFWSTMNINEKCVVILRCYKFYVVFFIEETWSTRAILSDYYNREIWPSTTSFELQSFGAIHIPPFSTGDIILPVLHIELGLFKQFVKWMDKTTVVFEKIISFFQDCHEKQFKMAYLSVRNRSSFFNFFLPRKNLL